MGKTAFGTLRVFEPNQALQQTFNDDGTVTLNWHLASDGDHQVGEGSLVPLEELEEEAPF
ncbi:hypothetical protein D3879_09955 [Pseudomonas cavernicola]|uniref:Uncharacterized protein n=1 Tax=Pseudomonas cavernicola TaxID=2320866 RepID=A0A418XM42_9PSED|nr:hypothetical protein [Pseudomonas cavernicola]RJG13540.1 hypothetical protein D3879_09955 [Pseudomonas cavernicola]